MSVFETIHHNAMLSSHNSSSTMKYQTCVFPNISIDAKEHLFYILNYAELETKYPFHISFDTLDAYLILYTVSGQGNIVYNNINYTLLPQTILFIDCHETFHVKASSSSTWCYHRFYINGNASSFLYKNYATNKNLLFKCEITSSVYQAITKLIHYIKDNEVNELICSTLINIFLTELVVSSNETSHQLLIPSYILQIQHLFDTQYYNNYSLDSLARQFHVSKYTLAKDFTKYLHLSPIEYLISVRIKIAKQLLINTDYTINEIANQLGIFDTTHFINLFKKRVGITPLQYRKQFSTDVSVFY